MANEVRRRFNFKSGKITDNPLSSSATVMNSNELTAFPAIGVNEYAVLVLDPDGVGNGPEIVYVTAHTAGATSATIVRGREGTSGVQHALNTQWIHGETVTDYPYVAVDASDTPAYSTEGQLLFRRSDRGLHVYNGVAWQPPWNMPWGKQAYSTSNSDHSGIGTAFVEVHIGFWRATWTAVRNRLYRLTVEGSFRHTEIDGAIEIAINNMSGNLVTPFLHSDNPFVAQRFHVSYMYAHLSATASLTIRLMMRNASSSGSAAFISDEQSYILVEDLGPVGDPV